MQRLSAAAEQPSSASGQGTGQVREVPGTAPRCPDSALARTLAFGAKAMLRLPAVPLAWATRGRGARGRCGTRRRHVAKRRGRAGTLRCSASGRHRSTPAPGAGWCIPRAGTPRCRRPALRARARTRFASSAASSALRSTTPGRYTAAGMSAILGSAAVRRRFIQLGRTVPGDNPGLEHSAALAGSELTGQSRPKAAVRRGAQPTPHTVTQVPGVGSLARPPMRRSRRLDVHTRSHTKLGSVLSSSLPARHHHLRSVAVCSSVYTYEPH